VHDAGEKAPERSHLVLLSQLAPQDLNVWFNLLFLVIRHC
jgi:hypothetical protein